jgi:hypothetical protein
MKFRTRKRERLILRGWLRLPAEVRQQYQQTDKKQRFPYRYAPEFGFCLIWLAKPE